MKIYYFFLSLSFILFTSSSQRLLASFEGDRAQLLNLSGCFLTDYNFAEKERLHESYSQAEFQKNSKRYDASAIEWIELVEDTGPRLLFQRIMVIDQGQTEPYVFKHHSEQWTYEPRFYYEYQGDGSYIPHNLSQKEREGVWRRDVNSLDDGPRYQCVARWQKSENQNSKATWACENYSPIPGREFRDMRRNDYQGLQRKTQIHSSNWGWKELQWNQKVREEAGAFIPFVSELGNTTYTKIEDKHCAPAKSFWNKRKNFWIIAREVWNEVLDGQRHYSSHAKLNNTPRYEAINLVAEEFSPGFVNSFYRPDTYLGFKEKDSLTLADRIRQVINEFEK